MTRLTNEGGNWGGRRPGSGQKSLNGEPLTEVTVGLTGKQIAACTADGRKLRDGIRALLDLGIAVEQGDLTRSVQLLDSDGQVIEEREEKI